MTFKQLPIKKQWSDEIMPSDNSAVCETKLFMNQLEKTVEGDPIISNGKQFQTLIGLALKLMQKVNENITAIFETEVEPDPELMTGTSLVSFNMANADLDYIEAEQLTIRHIEPPNLSVLIPIIRGLYPSIVANDIVGTQNMFAQPTHLYPETLAVLWEPPAGIKRGELNVIGSGTGGKSLFADEWGTAKQQLTAGLTQTRKKTLQDVLDKLRQQPDIPWGG